jgi:hypothetical protein
LRQLRAGRLLLLVLVALAAWAAPVVAQLGELPEELITAPTVSPPQVDEIKKFVAAQVADLETGDPVKLKRARQNLEGAANHAGATVSFRTAYSEALLPELDRLAKLANDVVVINAVQASGPLATQASIELAERYRADARPAVRLTAVGALEQTFRSINRTPPVVDQAAALQIVTNLGAGLDGEADPKVADAYVRALLEASRIEQAKFESVPDAALEKLVQSVGTRVRKLGDAPLDRELLMACIRAAEEVHNILAQNNLQRELPQGLVRDAGGLGGDLLAYVFRQIRSGKLPVAQGVGEGAVAEAQAGRLVEFTVTQLGVKIVYSARDRLGRGPVDSMIDVAGMIWQATAAGDREFTTGVGQIIGESGLLTRDPFNFNSERFQGR